MTLQTQRVQSLEQVCAFLEGNEAVDFVEGDREGVYDLVRCTLVKLTSPSDRPAPCGTWGQPVHNTKVLTTA